MKYTLATLAVIVSGCAAGNTAVRSANYEHGLETGTSVVEQRSPREDALLGLWEQGVVTDDTVQCAKVHKNMHTEYTQRQRAEYAALIKFLSARGESMGKGYKSEEMRRFVTVEIGKEGLLPVKSKHPARVYAYSQVKLGEAYNGAGDYFCVQSSAPLDLVLTGTYDNPADAILALKQAHAADEERAKPEMNDGVK